MDMLERYWYIAILGVVVALTLWFAVTLGRGRSPDAEKGPIGWIVFGPFWPRVDQYFSRRGGFSRREWLGWGVVLLLMIGAILFSVASRV
jgi:protein-S-isoprenylcysteine O-methyltransferase Ste14